MYNRLKDETHSNGNLPQTETTDLSSAATSGSSYGSTSLQDESVPPSCVPWCGLVFYVIAAFGYFSSQLLRTGLSVAIVAMVNQTAVTDNGVEVMSNVSEDQCPRDPVELQHEDGELNWDRNQQGTVLAAFFYGNEFTKVFRDVGPSYQVATVTVYLTMYVERKPVHENRIQQCRDGNIYLISPERQHK